MKYKVLKSLVYGGTAYAEGQEVDIIEKSVVKNCLERELIEEIKDTAEKVVSKTSVDDEDNQDIEKDDKGDKKNKNK